MSRKVHVSLSVEINAILDVPLGTDLQDISGYDFIVDGLDYNGEGDLHDYSVGDVSIDTCDFDD